MKCSTLRLSLKSILPALLTTTMLLPAAAHAARRDAHDGVNGMLGFADGEQIFVQVCQGCHMPDGRGAQGAGHYPAFAGNPAIASANYLAATILNGRRNMPSFERPTDFEFFFDPLWLNDTQVANVVNYLRTHFGNHYEPPITPAEVAALHPRQEGE